MALKGNTKEEQIWNFLKEYIANDYGIAGLMGNLDAESGLNPKNLENLCERRLKEAGKTYCTDETYTAAVDSGKISREEFLHPLPGKQYGYGLAQWTSAGRKAGLYDLAKSKGVSIGDLETQLEFLVKELSTSYKGVLSVLKTAASVKAASDKVLTGFECPSDQSESVKSKRAGYGQQYYDKFAADRKEGDSKMTEVQVRQKVVGIMQGWVGLKRSDKSHAPIIDTYNGRKPLPRGYKVTYTDAYCATTVSAAAIRAGFTDIMPVECSCYYLIEQAKKMGIWQENDAYVPMPADEILYDWDDGTNYAATDNTGSPEHVGMVEKVSGDTITVIEGNINGGNVGRRTLKVNGRYIRGYITPNYKEKADEKDLTPEQPAASGSAAGFTLAIGTIVNFTGSTHYTSSNAASGKGCKPGKAKITGTYNGKHPYHLEAVSGGGSTVHGWVDAADIKEEVGSSGQASGSEIKVGDIVKYSGTVHYTSSYASGKSCACKGGKAKVTQISKGNPHPYHLESAEKSCTVYGWVNADKVSR